jgi:DNA-binding beta-propeller fold protein YncE
MTERSITCAAAFLFALASGSAAPQPRAQPFAIVKHIAGPDGQWDYAIADAGTRRLYVGREYGVMALDLDSGVVTNTLVPGKMVHGIAAVGATGVFVSTNGNSNTATFFTGSNGKVLGEVHTGKDPDAVVYEPKTGLVAIADHEGGDVTLIDPNSRTVVGTIPVGGELEFAAADGAGRVYINVANKRHVAVVDVAARKVVGSIPLPGCEDPSGLAYDEIDHWVISVCFNGVADIVDPATRRQIAHIPTGKLPDAAIWDSAHKLLFVPSFADGSLTVIAIRGPQDIKVTQTLTTQPGTRTGALDAKSGSVYLPTSKLTPPAKEGDFPTPVPGTFEVLVVAAH